MNRILVTGGCGFIGSAFIRAALKHGHGHILNIDKLTYAATSASTAGLAGDQRYGFRQFDICDQPALLAAITSFQPDCIVHFAAESHVDRSIDEPSAFMTTNIMGTYAVAECTLRYWQTIGGELQRNFRLIHVSTDEVFGSLEADSPPCTEASPYAPNSPYAASKAASDHIIRAWHKTYGLPAIVVNLTNNYGPFQFPEKLIPVVIGTAMEGKPIPIYGDGRQIRDWLYVEDSAEGLVAAIARGRAGATYLFSADAETANIDLVQRLCCIIDELCPLSRHRPHHKLVTHVIDRPAHDRRYGLNSQRTRSELSWQPRVGLNEGLRRTVQWYLDNQAWWRRVRETTYDGQRLGLRARPSGMA